jgi:hypothetical protein
MIRLNTTTRTLRAFLAGAITTSQLPITVGYSDGTTANYSGAAQLTLTNSATPVTICAAPAASTIRDIDYIAVSNTDTVAATVTIQVNDNGTFYEQVKATLQPGRQLVYTHAQGWNVGDVNATPIGADPSASVGLTAVNGTALTFMRSDAAPALSQAIVPTWTGAHTFSSTVRINAPFGLNIAPTTPCDLFHTVTTGVTGRFRETASGMQLTFRIDATAMTVGIDTANATGGLSLGTQGTAKHVIDFGGDLHGVAGKWFPPTPPKATQSVCAISAGTGAPNNADGANGDIYFNAAGGALTTIYQRRAGAWVAVL